MPYTKPCIELKGELTRRSGKAKETDSVFVFLNCGLWPQYVAIWGLHPVLGNKKKKILLMCSFFDARR
jgi:hypothetical protein